MLDVRLLLNYTRASNKHLLLTSDPLLSFFLRARRLLESKYPDNGRRC